MCDLSFPFVHDLIILSAPFLIVLFIFSSMKRALDYSERPSFDVSRETKKSLKSWCYDERKEKKC